MIKQADFMVDMNSKIMGIQLFLVLFFVVGIGRAQPGELLVDDLKVEYFTNPIGIGDDDPRLSWKIFSDQRNTMQTAYRVQVSESSNFSGSDMVWDTGKISSGTSVQVPYQGADLESRKRYYWRVQVWDNHGNSSGWSDTSYWEMGLLNTGAWRASWIEPGLDQDTTKPQPSPMLRKEFELPGDIKKARVYVTSHGLYQMEINGQEVGDQLFTPGWTSYNNRLQYQTYDITELLKTGENAVGVTLGDGWFRGWIGFSNQRNYYGTKLGLLAQIEIVYQDGRTEYIVSDDSWKASTGPIRMSDIYDGEIYDARLEKEGWSEPGYDDSEWTSVRLDDNSMEKLIAPEGPPVRKIQEIEPVDILTTPEGDTVVDMGQNMVGWIQLKVNGSKGDKITLQHAEVLDQEGNFYTENLRAAEQKDTYILKGGGEEIFEPHFTFHGFRYVKVEGYPGNLTEDDLTGIVIHSDMEPTGHLETSNALVNQLQHNIVWGQKGNFLDVPTDCPQRDERLGWTGDIQVFAQTACYNMDAAGFLTKWLGDLEADQLDSGSVPFVIPNVLGEGAAGASGWGDASVVVPWTLYQAYGDKRILQQQYDSMKSWVEFMRKRARMDSTIHLWDNNFTFGDWLSFNSDASDYPGAYTDKELISTAFFAHSADLLHRTADVLGKKTDSKKYQELFEDIKASFQQEYLTPNGRVLSNTQTSYLLALKFDLLPDDLEHEAVRYLVADIQERGHHTTGFLGTPYLNPVLTDYGFEQQAFELLLSKDYPSWLYPVTMGATTIWERWDGIKPDGSFQNPGMNSYNHYAYGAIGEWLYKSVAGIEPAVPGYKEISIDPTLGGDFKYIRSIKESMYGRIESEWHLSEDEFTLTVDIPANTSANITLPGAEGVNVTVNDRRLGSSEDIGSSDIKIEGNDMIIAIGSGRYSFGYPTDNIPVAEGIDHYNIDTPVSDLLENEEAKGVLKRYIPGALKEEQFLETDADFSQWANSSSQVSNTDLKKIDEALTKIKITDQLRYSDKVLVGELIANEQARSVLQRHLPELISSPWMSQVMGYTLNHAANSLPAEFRINSTLLNKVKRDLQALSKN